jgi:glycosyltransferase involved in cell wall biosynthesis
VRIAFYAPLKAPTDAVPSGDRRIGRLLMAALSRAGHEVTIASTFRSRDGTGDAARQLRLRGLGHALADRYLRRNAACPPELWFTYHLYDRAPDWIGPRVAAALGIPYVVAEASLAPRRAAGAWRLGHEAAVAALARADAVIGLNSNDRACVEPVLGSADRYHALKPFLDAALFAPARGDVPPGLIAVGMMRPGDKLGSYLVLGAALARLRERPWRLSVVGDGPARREVEAALAAVADRVEWRGAVREEEIPALLGEADLCVWPAVNEAYGVALLEAQAAALPVVAGRSGGVGDVVADGESGLLVPVGDDAAFAAAVGLLLDDAPRRRTMGAAARRRILAEHDIGAAASRLDRILARLR